MKSVFNNKLFRLIFKTLKVFYITLFFIYIFFNIIIKLSININLFGYYLYPMDTNSMNDIYNVGDVLIVKDTKNIKTSNDILYKYNDRYIISRVYKIDNNNIYTKNTNSNYLNEVITYKELMGKVIYKNELLTFFYNIFNNLLFVLICILIPILIVIILDILFIITDKVISKSSTKINNKTNNHKNSDVSELLGNLKIEDK
jgi:hypothetical protein